VNCAEKPVAALMLLAANIAVEREVIVTAVNIALFIFTHFRHSLHQHTFNRSRAASLL